MHFPNKKLQKDIAALGQRRTSSWALIGTILDQVDHEKDWAYDARSFSEWMKSFALSIGMNESSLWRYLSAIRYYQKLRKDLNLRKELPDSVSAEGLELLEKLERVVPKKEFDEVAGRVLGGDVKRNELRELWKTYRPILTGRTARGKNVIAPRVDPMDREQRILQTEARVLTTLMWAGPEWTGLHDPQFYYPMREVVLPRGVGLQTPRAFDMLAIVRKTVESPVMLIAVEICSRIKDFSSLDSVAPYCDRLWVALVGKEKIPDKARLPVFVGILRVKAGGLRVERAAGEDSPGLGAKTGEMVKELLIPLLRG
jgi:hypothetical protein